MPVTKKKKEIQYKSYDANFPLTLLVQLLFQITRGGKADLLQSIAVGDEVLAINGIPCVSRAEAMELVRYSRQKLKISLRR